MKEIRNKWKALVLLVVLALMFGSFTVQAQDPYPGPGTEVPTRQPTITPIPSGMASYCGYTVDTNEYKCLLCRGPDCIKVYDPVPGQIWIIPGRAK